MAVFVLSVAAVKTAYDAFITAQAAVADARGNIVLLGPRPTYPMIVVVNADWNSVVTAQDTYDASMAALQVDLETDLAVARTAELAVIGVLGYNSGSDLNSECMNQWVKVVGTSGGILTYTNYIGAATNSTYLTVSDILPTLPFPNVD